MVTQSDKKILPYIEQLGGVRPLAAALGLTKEAVYMWIQADQIPARHWFRIEHLSGGTVTAQDLATLHERKAHQDSSQDSPQERAQDRQDAQARKDQAPPC